MDTETVPGVEVLRLDGPLYFANAAQARVCTPQLSRAPPWQKHCLSSSQHNF